MQGIVSPMSQYYH